MCVRGGARACVFAGGPVTIAIGMVGGCKKSETSVLIQLVPRLDLFHRSKQTNKHHVSILFTSVMCVCFVYDCGS